MTVFFSPNIVNATLKVACTRNTADETTTNVAIIEVNDYGYSSIVIPTTTDVFLSIRHMTYYNGVIVRMPHNETHHDVLTFKFYRDAVIEMGREGGIFFDAEDNTLTQESYIIEMNFNILLEKDGPFPEPWDPYQVYHSFGLPVIKWIIKDGIYWNPVPVSLVTRFNFSVYNDSKFYEDEFPVHFYFYQGKDKTLLPKITVNGDIYAKISANGAIKPIGYSEIQTVFDYVPIDEERYLYEAEYAASKNLSLDFKGNNPIAIQQNIGTGTPFIGKPILSKVHTQPGFWKEQADFGFDIDPKNKIMYFKVTNPAKVRSNYSQKECLTIHAFRQFCDKDVSIIIAEDVVNYGGGPQNISIKKYKYMTPDMKPEMKVQIFYDVGIFGEKQKPEIDFGLMSKFWEQYIEGGYKINVTVESNNSIRAFYIPVKIEKEQYLHSGYTLKLVSTTVLNNFSNRYPKPFVNISNKNWVVVETRYFDILFGLAHTLLSPKFSSIGLSAQEKMLV